MNHAKQFTMLVLYFGCAGLQACVNRKRLALIEVTQLPSIHIPRLHTTGTRVL
jgi:hypothetical protein